MEIVKINYSLQVASISSPNYDVKFDRICLGGFEYTIRSLRDLQQFSDPNGEALVIRHFFRDVAAFWSDLGNGKDFG